MKQFNLYELLFNNPKASKYAPLLQKISIHKKNNID